MIIRLSVVIAFSLLTFGSTHLRAQSKHKGCPAGIQRDVLKTELDRASSAAVDAIRSGKPEKLLPLLAEKGVFLGVDGPLVSLTAIRKEMTNKTGIYCVIFDSTCLRREVNESRKKAGAKMNDEEEILSFRDRLLRSNHAIETGLTT